MGHKEIDQLIAHILIGCSDSTNNNINVGCKSISVNWEQI